MKITKITVQPDVNADLDVNFSAEVTFLEEGTVASFISADRTADGAVRSAIESGGRYFVNRLLDPVRVLPVAYF